jgi:peptidoglycan hydrolase-like protein with peptidoglycan-binding domain
MYEEDFRNYVVPYMDKINKIVTKYRIGVYCSRQGCQILKDLNLATGFFISGASHGFSGNMGVCLPDCWNFEQFSTDITLKTVEIDKVSISLTYKDCIADFNKKEKKDYTSIIFEKLENMEKIINEKYTQDQLNEFNALLVSLITNKFVIFAGAKLTNIIDEMMWFFNQVTHQGPWDLKVDKSWDETIGISPRPVFGLPGGNEYFFFHGKFINREELGNITYGYLGKAMLYPDTILYMGGGMAANGKSLPQMILKSAINLDLFKPPYFGDSKEDHYY